MRINDRKAPAVRQVGELRQLHERSRLGSQQDRRYVKQQLVGKTALQGCTRKRWPCLDEYFIDLKRCKSLQYVFQIQFGASQLLDFGAALFERPAAHRLVVSTEE